MKILVVGGTGLVGSVVVQELLHRNADVRLLVRDAKTAAPSGVDFVVGDLLDPPAVERAMNGTDKLYLLNAVTPEGAYAGTHRLRFGKAAEARARCVPLRVSR